MKTKDLIKALQAADPEGETECVVGNHSVVYVYTDPAYWDGCMQIVTLGDRPKGKVTSRGEKVVIRTMGLDDLILDYPDAEVEIDVYSEDTAEDYRKMATSGRQFIKRIQSETTLKAFKDHVLKVLKESSFEFYEEEAEKAAEAYFVANGLSYEDPIDEDIAKHSIKVCEGGKEWEMHPSGAMKESVQWRRDLLIYTKEGKTVIEKREKCKGNYSFRIMLEGKTVLSRKDGDKIFAAEMPDCTPVSSDGKVFLDFDREANCMEEAVSSAIDQIKKAGFTPFGPYPIPEIKVR